MEVCKLIKVTIDGLYNCVIVLYPPTVGLLSCNFDQRIDWPGLQIIITHSEWYKPGYRSIFRGRHKDRKSRNLFLLADDVWCMVWCYKYILIQRIMDGCLHENSPNCHILPVSNKIVSVVCEL